MKFLVILSFTCLLCFACTNSNTPQSPQTILPDTRPINTQLSVKSKEELIADSLRRDSILNDPSLFEKYPHKSSFGVPEKVVQGRTFKYTHPRFHHVDKSKKIEITEFPKGVFVHRNSIHISEYNHTNSKLPSAFKIDFIHGKNIRSIDLNQDNPYVRGRKSRQKEYPCIEDNHVNNSSTKTLEQLMERCDYYLINNQVHETDGDYIAVIYEMFAFKNKQFIADARTLHFYDVYGDLIAKRENISDVAGNPMLTQQKDFMMYHHGITVEYGEYDKVGFTIVDTKTNKVVFDDWDVNESYRNVSGIRFFDAGEQHQLYTFQFHYRDEKMPEKCTTISKYINFQTKEVRTTCLPKSEMHRNTDHQYIYENLAIDIKKFGSDK